MSGSAALLVILGVVGYLLLRHRCHRTRYRWDALEWQQNLFESTALGLGLFGACRVFSPLLGPVSKVTGIPFQTSSGFLNSQLPIPFAGSVVGALVLGLLLSEAANLFWGRRSALVLAVRRHGGSLRVLLLETFLSQRAVMLTLSSRKVYVGWVFEPPRLREPSHVVVFPTLSGARANDDLRVAWTTDYSPVYFDLVTRMEEGEPLTTEPVHFQLVIPLDSITSATYFDKELYDRHFAPRPKVGSA